MIPISDVVGFYTGSTVEAALAETPYKLIAPDGGINPVLSADNAGDVTLAGTGTFAIPLHLEHAGDPDTRLTFTDDDIEATVGGLSMLKLTEATQDIIRLGPGSGDVDINFNGDMWLSGATGNLGVGTAAPDTSSRLHVSEDINSVARARVENPNTGTSAWADVIVAASKSGGGQHGYAVQMWGHNATPTWDGITLGNYARFRSDSTVSGLILTTGGSAPLIFGTNDNEAMRIDSSQNVGIGETSPSATLHTLTTTAAAGVELYRADASEGGHFRVFDAASTGFIASFEFLSAGINGVGGSFTARVPAANDVLVSNLAGMVIDVRQGTSGTTQVSNVNLFQIRNGVSPRFTIDVSGNVGMNSVTSPSTELDIGAGAMEFAEMTAPAAGAANTARDYAEDDGSGNTRRRIKFSSGNAVTIAQDGGLQTYTPTNVVTDRSYDANATSVAELADVLGTLIADFQAAGVLG
jgi:hypothetical protein